MIFLIKKEGMGLNCSKEDSGKTLRKHHVKNRGLKKLGISTTVDIQEEVKQIYCMNASWAWCCLKAWGWTQWPLEMPSNCFFYFHSQQSVKVLLLNCLGKGNVFPFTESAHGILQSKGYGRHNWHSQASLTAAQPTIAKALHHGPAFQQFQPCGRLPPLGSGGITFLDAAPKKQSGRFRWGPGMWLQRKNPQLRAGEMFWTGLFEVNQAGLSSSDTSVGLLLHQHHWAFPPLAACLVLFVPDLCITLCLPKLPSLQLQRLWWIWAWVLSQLESSRRASFQTLHPGSWGTGIMKAESLAEKQSKAASIDLISNSYSCLSS